MDLVEQIDLTVNPPLWGAIDRRNRVVCEPAPLIYYHSARETSQADQAETAASSAMGSAVEIPVVETSVDVAARDGEGDGKVNSPLSEPPPTPSGSTDHAFDEATFVQKMAEHQVIDDEVMNGIQEVLVRLGFDKDQLPIFAEQDTLVSYEAKIESWMGQFNEDQKTDAQAVASALMSGALKKSDLNEKYLLQLAKKRRLEKQEKEEAEMRRLADVKARKMKELEEAQLEAENARKKARILEEQMSSSGLTPEPVTPPMGGIGGHMNPQMGWAPMNPAMGMAPMMPPVMSQTGAPHMMPPPMGPPHMMPPPMGPPQMMTPMGPQMPPTQVPPTLTKARPPYPEGHMGP